EHRQRAARVDLDERYVGGRVGADDAGRELAPVVEADAQVGHRPDHVLVRDQVAVFVDQEPGPDRRAPAVAARRGVAVGRAVGGAPYVHHGGARAVGQVGQRHRRRLFALGWAGPQRRLVLGARCSAGAEVTEDTRAQAYADDDTYQR